MKTNVTQTSIEAYHNLENEASQKLMISVWMEAETKAGRAHSIATIADHFALQGVRALSDTGRVSARLNSIKEKGVRLGQFRYRLESRGMKKNTNPNSQRQNEFFVLVIDRQEVEQIALFV